MNHLQAKISEIFKGQLCRDGDDEYTPKTNIVYESTHSR